MTLSLVLTSLVFCMVIGLPAGILLASSDRAQRWTRPLLDAMQTTPAFVYLVPVVMLFGIGNVPGVIVTIIFALPPLIRLTNLGIRQVRPDLIEASRAYGASPWQLLWKVQLPLAMPSIMAGVNQALMLSLSMVVIGFHDRRGRPGPDGAARHRPPGHGPGHRGRTGHRAAGHRAGPHHPGHGADDPWRCALVAQRPRRLHRPPAGRRQQGRSIAAAPAECLHCGADGPTAAPPSRKAASHAGRPLPFHHTTEEPEDEPSPEPQSTANCRCQPLAAHRHDGCRHRTGLRRRIGRQRPARQGREGVAAQELHRRRKLPDPDRHEGPGEAGLRRAALPGSRVPHGPRGDCQWRRHFPGYALEPAARRLLQERGRRRQAVPQGCLLGQRGPGLSDRQEERPTNTRSPISAS